MFTHPHYCALTLLIYALSTAAFAIPHDVASELDRRPSTDTFFKRVAEQPNPLTMLVVAVRKLTEIPIAMWDLVTYPVRKIADESKASIGTGAKARKRSLLTSPHDLYPRAEYADPSAL